MKFDFRTRLGTWIDGALGHALHPKKFSVFALLSRHWIKVATLVLWVTLMAIFYRYKKHTGLNNALLLEEIYDFLHSHVFGPPIYMLLFLVRPLFFFPATGLIFLAGALYGPWKGFLFTMLGMIISAQMSYWVGRFFTHQKDGKLDIPGDAVLNSGDNRSIHDATVTMLITRLIFLHYDITNYVAGAKNVNGWGFMIGTFFGIIPDVMIFILAGASFARRSDGVMDFHHLHPQGALLGWSIVILVASLILAKILRDYQKNKSRVQ